MHNKKLFPHLNEPIPFPPSIEKKKWMEKKNEWQSSQATNLKKKKSNIASVQFNFLKKEKKAAIRQNPCQNWCGQCYDKGYQKRKSIN